MEEPQERPAQCENRAGNTREPRKTFQLLPFDQLQLLALVLVSLRLREGAGGGELELTNSRRIVGMGLNVRHRHPPSRRSQRQKPLHLGWACLALPLAITELPQRRPSAGKCCAAHDRGLQRAALSAAVLDIALRCAKTRQSWTRGQPREPASTRNFEARPALIPTPSTHLGRSLRRAPGRGTSVVSALSPPPRRRPGADETRRPHTLGGHAAVAPACFTSP